MLLKTLRARMPLSSLFSLLRPFLITGWASQTRARGTEMLISTLHRRLPKTAVQRAGGSLRERPGVHGIIMYVRGGGTLAAGSSLRWEGDELRDQRP